MHHEGGGTPLDKALVALHCEARLSSLWVCHSLVKVLGAVQMGWPSRTNRSFNAWLCARAIAAVALRIRASCIKRLLCKVRTLARSDSAVRLILSILSTTFWTRCKTAGGILM